MNLESPIVQQIAVPKNDSGTPLVFSEARGSRIYTVDKKEYIDFNNAKGSVFLGHNPTAQTELIKSFLIQGRDTKTGYHQAVYDVARHLTTKCDYETVAFFKTGTSAVKAAVDAAKAFTNLPIILSSGYHGYDPSWSRAKEVGIANDFGVVDFYYNINLLEQTLEKYAGKIAAIVISYDWLYLNKAWYQKIKKLIEQSNILLIADEVKSGYRYQPGALSAVFSLEPEMVVFSKGIANGYPLAAVLGQKDILQHMQEFSYTSFFDPITFLVASNTLGILDSGTAQKQLQADTLTFVEATRAIIDSLKLPIDIIHNGPLFQFVIYDKNLETQFYHLAYQYGLLLYEKDNQAPSIAFTGTVVNDAISRIERLLTALKQKFGTKSVSKNNYDVFFETAWGLIDGLPFTREVPQAVAMQQLQRLLVS